LIIPFGLDAADAPAANIAGAAQLDAAAAAANPRNSRLVVEVAITRSPGSY
jgi:hypothetical protein